MDIAWTIVGVVVALFVGIGFSVLGLSPPEYTIARTLFWLSAVLLGGVGIVWEIRTEQPTLWRITAGILIWVCVGVGLPECLRWISMRQAVNTVNPTSALMVGQKEPIPLPPPVTPSELPIKSPAERSNSAPVSTPIRTDDPVGNLSKLGWAIKRDGKILQFEVAYTPLPNMQQSAGHCCPAIS